MRRWMLTTVGAGVSAISFWVTSAEIMAVEQNGFSLLNSEGDTTPRFEEAARIGLALNRHADLFAKPSWGGAEAGILINEWNYQFCAEMSQGGGNLVTSVAGWHRILWEAGIPVDFVEVSELDEEYISDYKVLILPFPLSLSENVARKLALYVERGGTLISEAAPGRINEFAFCNRGELSPVMRELFGVRQESFTMVREPGNGTVWSPQPRTWGEYLDAAMLEGTGLLAGHRLRANLYIQTFSVKQGEPCLLYGRNAVGVWRKAGEGTAVLLGTFAGHNGVAYRDAETRACIAALMKNCGAASAHNGKLLLRKRAIPGKEAWILTNPTEVSVTEDIDVSVWRNVEDLMGGQLTRHGDYVSLAVKSLDVRVLVLTK
jgi:beta-galactosidase